jgi:VCBS repeat-containing protein
MMARYNSDGSLDTSLDGDGFVITDFGGNDIASSIVLQPDGRLVIAGSTESDPKYQFALARYDVGGTFTYDPNGKFDGLAPGEHAFDTFTYVASDGVLTDTATVTITIQGGFQLWLPMISNY